MTYFAVGREHGPAWDESRGMREQEDWDAHAAFMDALAERGFIVLGGPLADTDKVLLIVDAASAAEVEASFADDPWTPMGVLRITSIEPWEILLRGPEPA